MLVTDWTVDGHAYGEYEISGITGRDNDIDGADLYQFIVDYTNLSHPYAGVNGDRVINVQDIARFAREFGTF